MDYPTLVSLHPSTLEAAANTYLDQASVFDQTATSWDSQVYQATVHAWSGQAGDTAAVQLQTSTNRLRAAASLLKQTAQQLNQTASDFRTSQEQLQQVNQMAQANGLAIHDDGSIWANPNSPQLPPDPTAQQMAMQAVAAELRSVLDRATAADQAAALVLNDINMAVVPDVGTTPGAQHAPGDPGGPGDGGFSRGYGGPKQPGGINQPGTGAPGTDVNQPGTGAPGTNVNQPGTGAPGTNVNQPGTGAPGTPG